MVKNAYVECDKQALSLLSAKTGALMISTEELKLHRIHGEKVGKSIVSRRNYKSKGLEV